MLRGFANLLLGGSPGTFTNLTATGALAVTGTVTITASGNSVNKPNSAGYLSLSGGTTTGSDGASIQLSGSASADTGSGFYNAASHVFRSINGGAAGPMQFGTHSALAAETVTGYITIKDFGGTTRKLAVVS